MLSEAEELKTELKKAIKEANEATEEIKKTKLDFMLLAEARKADAVKAKQELEKIIQQNDSTTARSVLKFLALNAQDEESSTKKPLFSENDIKDMAAVIRNKSKKDTTDESNNED